MGVSVNDTLLLSEHGLSDDLNKLEFALYERKFQSLYGDKQAPRFFYAPGRVNLIGEHTDYNDGFVLPMAINRGTLVSGVARSDKTIRAYSLNLNDAATFDLDASPQLKPHYWANYVEGVARTLQAQNYDILGANLLIVSNVPEGAGLSSSAALENAIGYALLTLSGYQNIDRMKLALAGQSAEHQYVGTQCGIMDQLVTALGQKGAALLIDCRSLQSTPVPICFEDVAVVICDSRVKHALASSAYNQRVLECQQSVEYLRAGLPEIRNLRDVDLSTFQANQDLIRDGILLKRARHVVTENERTLRAAQALQAGNTEIFGQLMLQSHASLRDDYEVSCAELDLLVSIAQSIPGVVGSRMTGGGFGGCTVSLVKISEIERFKAEVARQYSSVFGMTPFFYETGACKGVRELKTENEAQTSQKILNERLNQCFETAYTTGDLQAWLDFANERMPSIVEISLPNASLEEEERVTAYCNPENPTPQQSIERITLQKGVVQLSVDQEMSIRLYYKEQEVTTQPKNIPQDYPWFQNDPADVEDIAGYATKHVGRGSRGESPWPESQWPQIGGVLQGEQNWPHRDAAFGPYRLQLLDRAAHQKAILLSRPIEIAQQPDAYGVIPRGIFMVAPDMSVIMALQHQNRSPEGLGWSPWFVLGFAMPPQGTLKNPSVIFAFPDSDPLATLQKRMTKVWNYTEIAGQKIVLINPHAKTLNEPFKKLYADVNWTVIATQGADHIILTRSILRHEEQFFPFLEHGRHFIEVEHTGPRAQPGETSTVIIKHEFVPVSALSEGKITRISGEVGRFEEDVRTLLAILVSKQQAGLLVSAL